jgi:hypothetical protein
MGRFVERQGRLPVGVTGGGGQLHEIQHNNSAEPGVAVVQLLRQVGQEVDKGRVGHGPLVNDPRLADKKHNLKIE